VAIKTVGHDVVLFTEDNDYTYLGRSFHSLLKEYFVLLDLMVEYKTTLVGGVCMTVPGHLYLFCIQHFY